MKDIKNFDAPKYGGAAYTLVEDGIYKTEDNGETVYVTSLSFIQEPEFDEGSNAAEISQYPLEDLLDEFGCWISDFYDDLNTEDSTVCYQEFASGTSEEIKNLRSIMGKHVYEKQDGQHIKLCIE
ncbi:MAG: hypothetical protein HDR72_00840 [Ruminococcaceae bacterium]|nr:hypothetical protein [Oscillospiraceae bacterium]